MAIHYSGAGNTFLVADNRTYSLSATQLLKQVGDADGVILVEKSLSADARMRIYNRDGSEAEMCGNGLRCLIHFLKESGVHKEIYAVDTLAGRCEGWFEGNEVAIKMAPPTNLQLNVADGLHFINTGVPHAVLFVDALEEVDVASRGKKIRHSAHFAPAGANANFVSIKESKRIAIRTYERGVEGETLACGTGAVASAIIAHRVYDLPSPVEVRVRSGSILKISFNDDYSQVTLQGPVEVLGERTLMKEKSESIIMSA